MMHKSEWLSNKPFDAVAHWHKRMRSLAASERACRANGWRSAIGTPPVFPPAWTTVHAAAWERLGDEERALLQRWRDQHVAPGEQPDAAVVEAHDREFGRYY
jgi:hypothetical protein